MKICYVYDAVYPWETGGVQKRVWELARRLSGDHDVHWYGLQFWDGPSVVQREGVTLHGVGDPPDLYVGDRRSIGEALSYSVRLVGPLLRDDFDVIDCQEFPYFPCFPSKLRSLTGDSTLFLTWHEVWADYWYEYLGRLGVFGKAVERAVARLPDEHVSVSGRTRRELKAIGGPESPVVPNGISAAEIERAPEADVPVDVLFVGRLIPEKNPELVVRAAAELAPERPDFRCVLVGDGPERARVERAIDELGVSGNVDRLAFRDDYEEVLGLLKAADAFLLPSEREGFGITVLEALACGTPVVTVDHPRNAATELVTEGETGYVTRATPTALADAVRRAIGRIDPADCVAATRRYEWDAVADRMEATYREAL
jgi:glycosyltransferase involved in cell wall biosynthesis